MNRTVFSKIFVCLLILCGAGAAQADLQGSKHDFSAASWNTSGEVCLPCHTPHNANSQNSTPLWNHSTTQQTFTLYTSPTMDVPTEQPKAASKACLSCHDGTIALDSFGGNNGTHSIGAGASVGTDLSDDHPVSVKWKHQVVADFTDTYFNLTPCTNCHLNPRWTPPNPPDNDVLAFFNGYVECATCHDVHNGTPHEKMLRVPTQNGQLCLYCHAK